MTVRPFDPFAPNSATVLVLLASRVGGLVLVAPVFSAKNVPVMLRTALVVVLTVLLQPAALAQAGREPSLTPVALLGETVVGFALGLGAALLVGAAEAAGDLIAVQIGLSGASLVDPFNSESVPVLGTLTQMLAVTLVLAMDGHLVMIDALAQSTRVLPVGGAMNLEAGMAAMVSMTGTLFVLGLRFAAPVIAIAMISTVALAVLSRAAPQLNILSVAFPIQITIGLGALAAALPFIAQFFNGWSAAYDGLTGRVLDALASLPR